MRIIHVINSLATGGAERLVVNLALEGTKMGHDVSIVTLVEEKGIPHQLALEQQIPVKAVSGSLRDPRNFVRLRRATAEADIVHVHIFPSLYWAAFISRPKVYTEHSSDNRRRNKKFLYPLERWFYSRYRRVIAISDGVESSLKEHFYLIKSKTQIVFAANGVTDDFFKVERVLSNVPSKIVCIGSLRPIKQVSIAIRAVSLLEGTTLSIAGDGSLKLELQKLVQDLKVEDRITFLGNVKDVPALLQNSDLLLTTSAHEGMSTVAVEAQASGIPVVGPDVPGVRDVIVDGVTGKLYKGNNPENVASAIREVFSQPFYSTLCGNARNHVNKYSMSNSFTTQLDLYTTILDE